MNQAIDGDSTLLYLVRHGATDANLKRPYVLQGRGIDLGLNETGREQANAVARFLTDHEFAHVYSSPMKRAVETAQMIAADRDVRISAVDGLQECDVGKWEGMDWDSIMQKHPDEYRAFIDNPAKVPYLDGESYGHVLRRARLVIGNLLLRHRGESIVVVAHNVVNRAYVSALLGLELRKAKDLHQSNCCVNVIRYRNGETKLVTMNACFHLDPALAR